MFMVLQRGATFKEKHTRDPLNGNHTEKFEGSNVKRRIREMMQMMQRDTEVKMRDLIDLRETTTTSTTAVVQVNSSCCQA